MSSAQSVLRVGVIGYGQWGPNHVRNFNAIEGCSVASICDRQMARLQAAQKIQRGVAVTTDAMAVIRSTAIDAVVIASPTATHFELVKAALLAGKDVLCEKPLAISARECRLLADLAARKRRILMVGHVFLYNASTQLLKVSLDNGELGRVYYIDAIRTNLGPVRRDVGAIHDLASHDISIFNFLLGGPPLSVSATGNSYLQAGIEDIAFLTLHYPRDVVCHVHVSWLNPRKVRQLTIVGDRKMAVWDDMNNLEPVRYYDKGVTPTEYRSFGEFQMILRDGQITIPKLKLSEPLMAQDEAFVSSVRTRKPPASNARFGLEVVQVIEAAIRSLARKGRVVPVAR